MLTKWNIGVKIIFGAVAQKFYKKEEETSWTLEVVPAQVQAEVRGNAREPFPNPFNRTSLKQNTLVCRATLPIYDFSLY